EPDPYYTGGRHSGEYQVLRRTGGYRPTWQAALEPAPAHMDHDEATSRYSDSPPPAWAGESVSTAPTRRRRSRRRHDAMVEVTEAPNDPPVTRRPAAVLTDEEFWAHMRGDALR